MISNQEEDEFVAVRVQDPRMQNEGSWNSYVDYKIFLHTNSKAFTAKTSCVRRRYSEFSWLKKKLQKNTGLVPVPELPGKSFFFFSSEDFLEKRRRGLQAFLDSVVNMTVCLSDSQLHLFLQTQLPVGHIQDCVHGHTPYSVTDAILTYASSNRGYAQAQEEDAGKEPSLTVSYESMESPAPHQPKDLFSPELLFCGDSDPPGGSPEIGDAVERQSEESSSVRVVQENDRLQAEATFFLGGSRDALEGLGLEEPTQQSSCCRIQTPAEVHSTVGAGLLEEECWVGEEGADETGPQPEECWVGEEGADETGPQPEECWVGEEGADKTGPHPEECWVGEEGADETGPQPEECWVGEEGADETGPQPEECWVGEEGADKTGPHPEECWVGEEGADETGPQPEECWVGEEGADETGPQPEECWVGEEGADKTGPHPEECWVGEEGADETGPHPEECWVGEEGADETGPHPEECWVGEEGADETGPHPEECWVGEEGADETGPHPEECWVGEEGADETGPHPEEEEDQRESSGEAKPENVVSEPKEFANSAAISYFMDRDFEERGTESDAGSQEEVPDAVCGEPPALEESKSPEGRSDESQSRAETALPAEIHQETLDVLGVPEASGVPGDLVQQADLDAAEDGHSSSNESIVKVSDDECVSGDAEDSIPEAGGWSPVEASSRTILDLHTNGHSVGNGDVSGDEEPRNATSKSLDANLTGEDLTENSDFSILESSCLAAGDGPEGEGGGEVEAR